MGLTVSDGKFMTMRMRGVEAGRQAGMTLEQQLRASIWIRKSKAERATQELGGLLKLQSPPHSDTPSTNKVTPSNPSQSFPTTRGQAFKHKVYGEPFLFKPQPLSPPHTPLLYALNL